MRKVTFYLIITLVVIGVIFGITLRKKSGKTPAMKSIQEMSKIHDRVIPSVSKETKARQLNGEYDIQNVFVNVAKIVGPAVVAISTERTRKVGFQSPNFQFKRFGKDPSGGEGDPFEKFFENFFGNIPEREFKQKGLGSGFIIDKEGYILTNNHVVEGADEINVVLPDGRNFKGTVKGADPRSDLAVVKIEAKDLPVVKLGDSNLIQIGEWVVALGNPFGHILMSPEPTVTVGVVSALHRKIPTIKGQRGFLDLIQTDAAINPGNSGGPLCNLNGNVIGINVAIFSTSGGYQGIGFAIPMHLVKEILGDLIEGKEITYGWLGVNIQEITPDIAEYLNMPDKKGALVAQVLPDSPAKEYGMQEGDVIVAVDGNVIDTVYDLLREINKKKVGQKARVDVIRDRVKKSIDIKIGKRPVSVDLEGEQDFESTEDIAKWRGMHAMGISKEIARELALTDTDGVVVIAEDLESPAYESGLRKGDVIREINRTKIKTLADFRKITEEAKGSTLIRADRLGYITVKDK